MYLINKSLLRWLILFIGLLYQPIVSAQEVEGSLSLLTQIEKMVVTQRKTAESLVAEAESDEVIMSSDSLKSYLYNIKGYIELTGANYPKAVSFFQTARQLAVDSENKIQEAESYRREGIVLMLLNQYSDALALLDKSLKLHLAAESPKASISLGSIVNIYELLGQLDQQMEYSWLLLEEALKSTNYNTIATAHYSIGSVFLARGNLEQAEYHFEQQKIANRNDPSAFTFMTDAAYAKLYREKNEFALALSFIKNAKATAERSGFALAMPSILVIESDIRKDMGDIDLAIQLLNRAEFMSSEVGISHFQLMALTKLVEIYEQKGDVDLAFQTLKRQQTLRKESQIDAERQLLAVSQARLDLDTKNREISTLKLKQEISQQRQTNQVLMLSLTGMVIAILAFFTFRLRKQKHALGTASEEIQRATNAKSEFLARMSHEIRTPLNAIVGLTKLSLRSSEDQRQATNLKQIEESSQTLLGLINDILDFSKIEAGKMTLESTAFSLDEVIDSALRMHALKAQEKGLELIKFVSPDVPLHIRGDALRLQQVLNNLLSNAVKFTAEGSITLIVNRQYTEDELQLQFEVKDTGRGLSTAQRATLFDSFSQADESITRNYGGTGLGLAISKQLVELMGGTIWVESVPSQGATFFFTIQTQRAELNEHEARQRQSKQLQRALVISSDAVSRELVDQTLARMNVATEVAEDGLSGIGAWRQAQQHKDPFDVIIVDWQMSDIQGIEVVSIVRQEVNSAPPQILLMTDASDPMAVAQTSPSGVDVTLEKPLNASAIFNALMSAGNMPDTMQGKTSRHAKPSSVPVWKGVHILLAEDNALNRKVALGYLEDTQAKISVVENGLQAIEVLLDDSSVDVVLMDIQMPEMDGLTAAQKIRSEISKELPIIAMTAHAIDEDIKKSTAVGMNAHIIKPIEPQTLIDTIQQQLNKDTY
ncbi:response regulator [Alteromonas oceanisediminis]|uniref:response regulator n=1 Tax=Alteromonas oceanisediminis TaxID=2836180 RepID=UPI001BDAC982|nr:response regulator [Alteromonas oceanisediminis]MBT0586628.1 response regulator [Alteromonas oceanisediminis]